MNGGREKQKGLQTVERALEVLYLFREYEGITLSFVTEKLGMCPAVAYRLLYTLTDSGFLRMEKAGKRYYLCFWAIGPSVPRALDRRHIPRCRRLRVIAGWMYFSPSEWICRACVWKSWM